MSQRFLGWILFWLLFVVSLFIAWQILDDLPEDGMGKTTGTIVGEIGISELWFESLKTEKEARTYRLANYYDKAITRLDEAEEMIRQLYREKPDFYPDLVQDRLEDLEDMKRMWKAETQGSADDPGKGEEAFAMNEPEAVPAVSQFGIDPTADFPDAGMNPLPEFIEPVIPAESEAEPELPVLDDPLAIWLRAHSAMKAAENLESAGESGAALERFRESKGWYDQLAEGFPSYQSQHVETRREMLAEKLRLFALNP